MTEMHDVIIVGSGPSGLSSALYASRSGLDTVIIEKGLPGGQLNNTSEIDNYIGGTTTNGMELADAMYEQAMLFGAKHLYGEVIDILQHTDMTFTVYMKDKELSAKVVIVATGTEYRKLGVPGEEEFSGRGLSYCAVCDAPFFKDKEVTVIGGGDSALEEADYLTNFASKVTIVHRRYDYRAKPHLQQRVKDNPKIREVLNVDVQSIAGHDSIDKINLYDKTLNENTAIESDGVFVYIGQNPQNSYLEGLKVTNELGYIETTGPNGETIIPGLFAVGDIVHKTIRQVANAVGEGAVAGQTAYSYIKDN